MKWNIYLHINPFKLNIYTNCIVKGFAKKKNDNIIVNAFLHVVAVYFFK